MSSIGLVLTGGGARAAYQVGVVRAIAQITSQQEFPFKVIAGVSAGAINGVALASGASNFTAASEKLWKLWQDLTVDQVVRSDTLALMRIGIHFLRDLVFGGVLQGASSHHLLDTSPLRKLLLRELDIKSFRSNIKNKRIHGIAITATNYLSGTSISFFEGDRSIEDWVRSNRLSKRTRLNVNHILASTAIPVFFPPVKVGGNFYGDGCVRLNSPLSPAIHMGAGKILAVGIRHPRSDQEVIDLNREKMDQVKLAEIVGILLDSVFMDSLHADLERLNRINRTLSRIKKADEKSDQDQLRPIPSLVLSPSEDLGALARDQFSRFPPMLRYLLKGIGANDEKGGELLSYLAFDKSYTTKLLDLGYNDAMNRKEEIKQFLGEEVDGTPYPPIFL